MTRYYKVQYNDETDELGLMPKSNYDLFGFDIVSSSYVFAHDLFEHNFLDTLKVKQGTEVINVNPNYVEHELVAMGHAYYLRALSTEIENIDFISGMDEYISTYAGRVSFPAYNIADFQCTDKQFKSWDNTMLSKSHRQCVKELLRRITQHHRNDGKSSCFDIYKEPRMLNYVMYWVRLGFNMAVRKYSKVRLDHYSACTIFKTLLNSTFIDNMPLVHGSTVKATMNFRTRVLTVTRLKDPYDSYDHDEPYTIKL